MIVVVAFAIAGVVVAGVVTFAIAGNSSQKGKASYSAWLNARVPATSKESVTIWCKVKGG